MHDNQRVHSTVAGETPRLEVQKTVQAINISGEFLKLLPISNRRVWQDVLDLTPGIMSRSTDRFGGQVHFVVEWRARGFERGSIR